MLSYRVTRLLIVAVLVVLLAPAIAAQDAPETPISVSDALAAYMPADALAYAALSVSDDALSAYDALVAEVLTGIPGVPQAPSIVGLFDELLRSEFDTDLESMTWLGDTLAIGVSLSSRREYFTSEVVIAAEITDPDGAKLFLDLLIGDFSSESEVRGDTTYYRVDDEGGAMVSPDVMVITSRYDLLPIQAGQPTLSTEPAYQSARGHLPGAYPAVAYLDLPRLYAIDFADRSSRREMMNQAPFIAAIGQVFGPAMIGFTRESGVLVMDVAIAGGNLTLPRLLDLPVGPNPVTDPAALALAPSEAFAVVHGADLLHNYDALWEAYGPWVKDALVQQQFGRMLYDFGTESALLYSILGRLEADQLADLGLSALLGVTMDDLRNWTAGDYIMFLMVNPEWPADSQAIEPPIEGAGVFTVGDPQQSLDALERLARALTLLRDSTRSWAYADVEVFRAEAATELAVTIRPDGDPEESFRISLIVSGEVAILGTQRAARTALADLFTRDVDPDAWLTEAQAIGLIGGQNLYLQPSQLVPYITAWAGRADDESEMIRTVLAKLNTMLISTVTQPDGSVVARFAIDLATAGEMETVMFRPTLAPAVRATREPVDTPAPVPTIAPPPTVVATVDLQPTLPPPMTPTYTPTAFPTPTPLALNDQPVVTDALGYNTVSFRGPDGAFTLGSPDAPVTLVVFSDWACPHCQNFEPTVQQFIAQHVVTGQANLEHRTFATAGGQATVAVGKVAACAEELVPGSFWEVSRQLYDLAINRPDSYSALSVTALVTDLLDVDRSAINQCIARSGQVEADRSYANEVGANGTPYLIVRYADGRTAQVSDRTIEGLTALVTGPMIIEVDVTEEPSHDPSAVADALATAAAIPLPTSAPVDLSDYPGIELPGSVVGTLRGGEPITYALTVPEGVSSVVITAASDDFDTTLELTTVGGISLAYNDDDNFDVNTNSRIDANLPRSSRQFLIVVASFGDSGTGEFTLNVSRR
ncbi:MAG: thioredoxin domain-containing protein [Chloroflexi bacterium]|nr:thioredoxin domain-containing protein [Chloroflexota bacterium]